MKQRKPFILFAKKVTSTVLAVTFLAGLGSCAARSAEHESEDFTTLYAGRETDSMIGGVAQMVNSSEKTNRIIQRPAEVRGVWLSYLEMQTMLENKTETEFTLNIKTAFDNIKSMGLNTIYAQVRPFADALYKSQYFPWSHTITGVEGENPGFDPLAIMVEEAHSRGLLLEAWINPYRIRLERANNKPLSATNQARKWLNVGDNSVVEHKNLISYNPASTKAQELIVNGVREIVENYEVDGVHIDDYFYPTTGTKFDQTFDNLEYEAYQKKGGTKSLGDWRRENVEKLVKNMYSAVKESNPNVHFGISPQSNLDTNYNIQYLDIAKITSTTGYCDYIAPQIYFGFKNKVQPYAETLDKWENIIKEKSIHLYVGLASYKVGTVDGYAGELGKNEWKLNNDLTARQIEYARLAEGYGGFLLFRYDHLFVPAATVKKQVENENERVKELLK